MGLPSRTSARSRSQRCPARPFGTPPVDRRFVSDVSTRGFPNGDVVPIKKKKDGIPSGEVT